MHARFDVTATEIQTVVAKFYRLVRQDAVLGPVFAVHVTDWPPHEEKIARFWRNAILFERSYDGNPMQKHAAAGNVKPAHFERWLALFDSVLQDELPEHSALAWSHLAHRIGRGLSSGLHAQVGGPPHLG